jgi:hypothetical protein
MPLLFERVLLKYINGVKTTLTTESHLADGQILAAAAKLVSSVCYEHGWTRLLTVSKQEEASSTFVSTKHLCFNT